MTRLSLAKEKVQVLLLEGIHENAVTDLVADGYANLIRLPAPPPPLNAPLSNIRSVAELDHVNASAH